MAKGSKHLLVGWTPDIDTHRNNIIASGTRQIMLLTCSEIEHARKVETPTQRQATPEVHIALVPRSLDSRSSPRGGEERSPRSPKAFTVQPIRNRLCLPFILLSS
jgi:hypothetical protein